jgi:hypothetical protein
MDKYDVRMIAAGVAARVQRDVFRAQCVSMNYARLIDVVEEQLRAELARAGTKVASLSDERCR